VFDRSDDILEAAARELRRPVATNPAGKARVMELVRASAVYGRQAERRPRGPGSRTGWTSPLSQFALAAGLAGLMVIGALRSLVPPRSSAGGAGVAVVGDSVASTIRDTLRLVRFMFVSPTASRVALAGDFNDWSAVATPLVPAESAGVWSVAVALAPGRHRYSFVVDDTQWVADPRAPRLAHGHTGRPASVMTVTTTSY
jgi:hypothetical protein